MTVQAALEEVTSKGRVTTREVWVANRRCVPTDGVPILQMALPVQPRPSFVGAFGDGAKRRVPVVFGAPPFMEQATLVVR